MNKFIKEMLQLGADLDREHNSLTVNMILNDVEILYRNHFRYSESQMDDAYDKGFEDGKEGFIICKCSTQNLYKRHLGDGGYDWCQDCDKTIGSK